MTIDRRIFSLGLVGLTLAGCSGEGEGAAVSSGLPNDLRPARNSGYDNWVATFRERAARQGFSQELLSNSFRGTGYLPGVIKRDRNQVEFKKSLEDYLSIAVSDERVLKGRAAFSRHQSSLKAIEDAYGVSAYIVTAIWGLESFYGERRGDVPVISATSTLAYDGRRGDFFEKQLIAALKILKYGDTTSANLKGSWAGAMGHTQFIPTSYLSFAVDFTGDGRRDIWSSDPSDALASTAAYLSKNGWKKGLRWGDEVVNGSPSGTIIQPQADGPRFSTTANFRVIKSYNNSDAYAIGVGHLADRIAGAAGLRTSFPPDEYSMTKNDRIALQKSLTKSGFDTGGSDGVIGPKTIQAISDYQRSRGLAVTGKPTLSMIDT